MKINGEGASIREYFTKALNGMALGLFSSLIIGLILKQIGELVNIPILMSFGQMAQFLMGPAIGAGVAFAVGAPSLGIFASIATGAIGANTIFLTEAGAYSIRTGEPVGAFVAALIGAEVAKLIVGKTKVDIVLIPALTIIAGGLAGNFIGPAVAAIMTGLGQIINSLTVIHPIPMGILVSALMGMILTLPISSAALAISLGLDGLAAGAAVVGCATQMIGFGVASYKENGFGGFIAQGLGTSMLQVPNIIKNPLIWIPPTLASALLGPLATTLFSMENNSIGAGMGTSGLVGQFGTFAKMVTEQGNPSTTVLVKVIILHFILPAIVTLIIAKYMRKKGWIKLGDMKLNQ
ncbi:phosphotransferase system, EIIC [Clostridium aceticum]|uniref:Phosphotransferase system, EIIC n=1 Tax=Clostridium aceticum TaxID=84022 RepID=A0A0D8I8P2_9CLOT|nr:PTS sugar transporter subunit IIC [Clostridium aceticum]AKL93541.1 phosphotransferase system, EIIC [Clostridium aceticum]KJF25606.1 PTS sugar transporter subunit IIC [Clostridium aceticum]